MFFLLGIFYVVNGQINKISHYKYGSKTLTFSEVTCILSLSFNILERENYVI